MLKTILEKAIGEDKQIACNPTHTKASGGNMSVCYNCSSAGGYNEAKAEMRTKIPQVVEEVRSGLKNLPQDERDWYEWLFKSLTENI